MSTYSSAKAGIGRYKERISSCTWRQVNHEKTQESKTEGEKQYAGNAPGTIVCVTTLQIAGKLREQKAQEEVALKFALPQKRQTN